MADELHINNSNNGNTADLTKTRKKRQTLTIQVVKKIRRGVEKGYTPQKISEEEELSLPTVYKIMNKITDGVQDEELLGRKPGKKQQTTSVVKSKISQFLLRDPSYSQKEISEELACNNISLTQSGISRILKKMNYTRKRLTRIPEERNTPRNINLRQVYARGISFVPVNSLVFLDETGVNLHHTRNYGYSPINEKAVKAIRDNLG